MKKVMMVAAAVLAGCAGVEESTGTSPTPTPPPVDGSLQVGDVTAATFNGETEELRVQIAFAGQDALQAFTRDGELQGYLRFVQQADGLTPAYTALARESQDGSVHAIVVAEGGQFARFVGGTVAVQNAYVAPEGGLARYQGNYVGLLNTGPVAGGASDDAGEATPRLSSMVTGNALLNADFNNMQVRGRINDRQVVIAGEAFELDEIILIGAGNNISADGRFAGTVEQRDPGSSNTRGVGSYSGTFGGNNAAAVAGMIALDGNFIDIDGVDNEFEYGIFVLDRCLAPSPGCDVIVTP